MTDQQRYNVLLEYAKDLVRNTYIDPYDVLHEAWVGNPDGCTKKGVNDVFWKIKREATKVSEWKEYSTKGRAARTKVCSKCGDEVPLAAFRPERSVCRACRSKQQQRWKVNNKKNVKKNRRRYYRKNKKKILKSHKQRYKENKDSIVAAHKVYYERNKQKRYASIKRWRQQNPDKIKEYNKRHGKNRKR